MLNLILENAQADERLWTSPTRMHEGCIADPKRLIANAEAGVAHNRAAADNAEGCRAAKDRVERLKRQLPI